MGNCCTMNDVQRANREIETQILHQKNIDKEIKKLLLLGSGSSGKSTLFRQIQCIHGCGLEDTDYKDSTRSIRENIVQSMIKLLKESEKLYSQDQEKYAKYGIDTTDSKIKKMIQTVAKFSTENFDFTSDVPVDWDALEELGQAIDHLWKLEPIIYTFNARMHFWFEDNMEYFFNKVTEVMKEHYEPNYDDVLRAKVRTTGIMERTYEISDTYISIYDVGGQRNERKKWIHCFTGVTAVIFVAALNHYNQVLFEDEGKNAMHESLDLFAHLCSSKWFRTLPMILFLNKDDLFRESLRKGTSLSDCFSTKAKWYGDQWRGTDYCRETTKADDDFETSYKDSEAQIFESCYRQALEFVRKQYIKCEVRNNDNTGQKHISRIFPHITNATDRNNIEKVFWDCQNIIVRGNLAKGGLM